MEILPSKSIPNSSEEDDNGTQDDDVRADEAFGSGAKTNTKSKTTKFISIFSQIQHILLGGRRLADNKGAADKETKENSEYDSDHLDQVEATVWQPFCERNFKALKTPIDLLLRNREAWKPASVSNEPVKVIDLSLSEESSQFTD